MIDPLGIQSSECKQASNLVVRKSFLLKLLHVCLGRERVSWCHSWPPFSQGSCQRASRPTVPICSASNAPRRLPSIDGELDEGVTPVTDVLRSTYVARGHGQPFRRTGRGTRPDRVAWPGQLGRVRRRSPRSPPTDRAVIVH